MRLLLTMVLLMTLLNGHAHALSIDDIRTETRRVADATPRAMDEAGFSRARDLFAALIALQGKPDAKTLAGWQELGYRAVPVAGGDTRFALLPAGRADGAQGVFLFDTGVARRDALQAPHLRDDTGTGELALRAYFAGGLFAAMTSTVRRHHVDLAREPRSLFTAFAAALADRPGTRLVQLHGFEREKRESAPGRAADTVVSSGTRWPGAGTLALRDCLAREFGGLHRVYGVDIDELGGTRNASRARFPPTHGGFLHLEMAREFRDRLLADEADQRRLFRCLLP